MIDGSVSLKRQKGVEIQNTKELILNRKVTLSPENGGMR